MGTRKVKYIYPSEEALNLDKRQRIEGALFPVLIKRKKYYISRKPELHIRFARLNTNIQKAGTDRLIALFKMLLKE